MTDLHWTDGKTTIVVPASVRGRFSGSAEAFQRLVCAIAVVVATVLGSMWITADAYADDSSSTGTDANSSVTITDNITDTENLLGSHATEVSDAIAKTEKETGVHVHLLYLSSFNSEQTPQKWASTVLESTKPKANTVLLAVAANDGNLVVAVSSNSDEWLKQQKTVDALSEADGKHTELVRGSHGDDGPDRQIQEDLHLILHGDDWRDHHGRGSGRLGHHHCGDGDSSPSP